jgi:hypothetical protein
MDAFYGMSLNLLRALDEQGDVFMADIHKVRHIYLADPMPYLPKSESSKGRKRLRYQSDETAVKVQASVQALPERAFQDAKSHLGMGHYQARKWASWHRHMALLMMAMQFMLQERMRNSDEYPLLSCCNIQVLLARTLPSRQNNELDVLLLMEERHRKRQAAIDSAKERQSHVEIELMLCTSD